MLRTFWIPGIDLPDIAVWVSEIGTARIPGVVGRRAYKRHTLRGKPLIHGIDLRRRGKPYGNAGLVGSGWGLGI